MKLIQRIDDVPVLGWLVGLHLRDADLSVTEYAAFCDDLEKDFARETVEVIRPSAYAREFRAFQLASKAVTDEFDKRNTGARRYLLRRPAGVRASGAKHYHIVEERFGGKEKRPQHTVVGHIAFHEEQRLPMFEIEDARRDGDAMDIVKRFQEHYAASIDALSVQRLRGRMSALLQQTAPFAYDAAHHFDFVSSENEAVLRLLSRIVDFCNERFPGGASAHERCSLAAFPVPNLDEYREQLSVAYLSNLDELVRNAENVMRSYREAKDRNPRELLSAFDSIAEGKRLVEAHAERLCADVAKVEVALYQLKKMGDVLVGIDRPTARPTGRCSTWKMSRPRYNAQAQEMGDILVAAGFVPGPTPRTDPSKRKVAEQITWSYGTGDDARIVGVQTAVEPGAEGLAFHINPDIGDLGLKNGDHNGMYRTTICGGGFFGVLPSMVAGVIIETFGREETNV